MVECCIDENYHAISRIQYFISLNHTLDVIHHVSPPQFFISWWFFSSTLNNFNK